MPKVLAASPPRGVGGNEMDHIDRACGTPPRTINAKVSRLKFSSYARLVLTGTEVSTKSLSRIPFRRLVAALVLTQDVVTCYTAVPFNKAYEAD